MKLSLNKATRDIIVREIPWLIGYLPATIKTLEVRGFSLDTLSLCPEILQDYGGNTHVRSHVQLLDHEGASLMFVGWFQGLERTFWKKKEYKVSYWEPETVEEALTRLPQERVSRVRYAILLFYDRVTLYRIPFQEESYSTWLANEVRRAESSLHFTLHKDWDW